MDFLVPFDFSPQNPIISSPVRLPFALRVVVVSPTIAAVGLSFYSYGFPRLGACVEIGAMQILLVVIFSLVSCPFHLYHFY